MDKNKFNQTFNDDKKDFSNLKWNNDNNNVVQNIDPYNETIDVIEEAYANGEIDDEKYADWLNDTKNYYESTSTPFDDMNNELEDIENKYNNGELSDDEYINKLNNLKENYEGDGVDVTNNVSNNIENSNDFDEYFNNELHNTTNTSLNNMNNEWQRTSEQSQQQIDAIEELRKNGSISEEEYKKAMDTLNNSTVIHTPEEPKLSNLTLEQREMIPDRFERENNNNFEFNLDDLQTLDEMLQDNTNNIDMSDFLNDETVGDYNKHYIDKDGYRYNINNNKVQSMHKLDEEGNLVGDSIDVSYNENGLPYIDSVDGARPLKEDIASFVGETNDKQLLNMSQGDWAKAEKNKKLYGFKDEDDIVAQRMFYNKRNISSNKKEIEKLSKDKRNKKQVEALTKKNKRLMQQQEALDYRRNLSSGENAVVRNAYKQNAKEAVEEFKKATNGIEKGSEAWNVAQKEMKEKIAKYGEESGYSQMVKNKKFVTKNTIDSIGVESGLTLGKVFNTAFAVKTGVDKYKESRAEGKGKVSSAIRGVGTAAANEMLGVPGQILVAGAKVLPSAIVKGGNMIYSETRRMNSAANFTPLGGTTFQDTQQLSTMRQSGMELAKMSQYNLEQTLMGSEAKHLHR